MAQPTDPKAGILLIRPDQQLMVPLTKERTTIGRKQVDISLDDAKTSALHAEILFQKGAYLLKDLGSTNGTFVNRQQVEEVVLTDQDVIEIGNTTLCFFENLQDFHGSAKVTPPAGEKTRKQDEPTESTKRTATQTVAQVETVIKVLEGANKGKEFRFRKFHITIGRGDTDLVLLDLDASRTHCMLEVLTPQVVYLRDLDSTNGTYLNGEKILSEKVKTNDKISIGNTVLELSFKN